MGSCKRLIVWGMIVCLMALSGTCYGVVYTVGGKAGWTTIGNINYNNWASKLTFYINDTLFFNYTKVHHNVIELDHLNYRSCNISSPRAAPYSSGHDYVKLQRPGRFYFVCGVFGHCKAGLKLDILVRSPSMGPSSGPVGAYAPV